MSDDIIRMAREAGMSEGLPAEDNLPAIWTPISTAELERFAALIAAAEREECAKVCEDLYANLNDDLDCRKRWPEQKRRNEIYAAAIRARKD